MRLLIATALVLLPLRSRLSAQVQEQKLLDRLLKPNTALQNDAQSKQFVPRGQTNTKTASTKSFFFARRSPEKQFQGGRNVTPQAFQTSSSRFSQKQADLSTRNKIPKAEKAYPMTAYADTGAATDAEKVMPTAGFAGNRKFEGRGKSQKSLSAQDHSMTIDEVRELLNKNK